MMGKKKLKGADARSGESPDRKRSRLTGEQRMDLDESSDLGPSRYALKLLSNNQTHT